MKPWFLLLIFPVVVLGQATEGDVVNAATGAPVAGACVSTYSTVIGAQVAATTDVAGHFRLPAQVAANSPLQIVRAGFLRHARPVLAMTAQATLHIELTPAAIISGKIVDDEGLPVEASVEAKRYSMVNRERKLETFAMTQSDDLGQYRFANLPAGRYWIRTSSGSAGSWDRRYVARYYPGTLRPDDSGHVDAQAGQEREGVDIRLTKYDGVTVSGRIEMPGPAGASWWGFPTYLQADPNDLEMLSGMQQRDGSFIIRHVPPGDYILRAVSGNYQPKAGELLGEQKLRVGDADERGIVLKAHEVQAVDLAGTILMQGGDNPPLMYIGLRPPGGASISARSDEDGSFVLKGLLPGHYDVQVSPVVKIVNGTIEPGSIAARGYPVSAQLGEKEVLQTGFDLDGTPGGPLRITVSFRVIEISGKLLNASGGPVSGALLALISDGPAASGAASTDVDGAFRVMLRQPGDYHIYFMDDQSNWSDPDYLEKHKDDFPLLRVGDGTNPPVTLRLPARQAK